MSVAPNLCCDETEPRRWHLPGKSTEAESDRVKAELGESPDSKSSILSSVFFFLNDSLSHYLLIIVEHKNRD